MGSLGYGTTACVAPRAGAVYPSITATHVGKSRMGDPAGGGPGVSDVAGLIVQAIDGGWVPYFATALMPTVGRGVGISPDRPWSQVSLLVACLAGVKV